VCQPGCLGVRSATLALSDSHLACDLLAIREVGVEAVAMLEKVGVHPVLELVGVVEELRNRVGVEVRVQDHRLGVFLRLVVPLQDSVLCGYKLKPLGTPEERRECGVDPSVLGLEVCEFARGVIGVERGALERLGLARHGAETNPVLLDRRLAWHSFDWLARGLTLRLHYRGLARGLPGNGHDVVRRLS